MIKSINIITSPFGCIPPFAIGAVEKLWKSCGDYYSLNGFNVCFISKKPSDEINNDKNHIYIDGYGRTGSWIKDFLLDFIYSLKALSNMPKCDALVLNTIWSPILLPLFKKKYKVSLYNVARFPKHQFGFYKSVDILSCVSSAVYKCLLKQSPTCKKQSCVISNFIDTSIFHPYKKHCLQSKNTILYTGRVHREKGLDLLIEAINIVRERHDVSLKIIGAWDIAKGGSGKDYKNELNSKAKDWKIDWTDAIYDPKKLATEMDKCDIYCYPSLAERGETFGVAPLEAMGLGLPTIVSDLDCFKDFVKDKDCGLIFNHRASDAAIQLASAITKILDDSKLYEKLSKNGAMMSTSFNIPKISEEYLLVMNNVMRYGRTGFNEGSMKVEEIK